MIDGVVTHLTADVAVAALYRVLVLAVVLVVGWPVRQRYHWPIGTACVFGIASNAAFFFGELRLSALFGVPYVGLIGWVFIRKMQDDPKLMRHLLASKEAAWSKERHDREGDVATLRARLDYCEKKLGDQGSSLPSE